MGIRTTYRIALPLVAAGLALIALAGTRSGGLSAQDEPRESAVCLECHDGQDVTLAGTAHTLSGDAKNGVQVACTDCHGTNRKHWEEGPSENPMIRPWKLDAAGEAKLCATCHQTAHQQNMLEKNVHAANGINCSDCHSIHASDRHTRLLKHEQTELCVSCHGNVAGDFARPFRHPVSDGVVKCSECHMTLDDTRRELSLNGTNVCTKCHVEFRGPFPHEHPATLDFSTDEGGCLNCHAAHGSDHPRMLTQPYEAPHYQLCTQCHGVPPKHNLNANHGTMWAGRDCNTCHTDIHGSYDNRFFLTESLRAEGCMNPSCHGR